MDVCTYLPHIPYGDYSLMDTFDQQFDLYLSSKNVGPEARYKLRNLLKYYAKKPHPFRACVRDNRKRFGPGTERVCATLKDIIRGTTHWRNNKEHDKGSAGLKNLSEDSQDNNLVLDININDNVDAGDSLPQEVLDALDVLTDDQLQELVDLAQQEIESNDGSTDEDVVLDQPSDESGYTQAVDGGMNCSGCSHFHDGLCSLYVAKVDDQHVCDSCDGEAPDQIDNVMMSELYFSEAPVSTDTTGKGIWKTVLRTGTWLMSPNGGKSDPLSVVRGKGKTTADGKTISLDDIVDTFKLSPMDHVTVPLEHTSAPDKNTGYVRDVVLEENGDNAYLKALIDFTEPDIEQKVVNGSIANTSVGLKFGYRRKSDGERFPVVLDHVALTNKPWIDGLPGFGLSEVSNENIPVFVYAEADCKNNGGNKMDPEVVDTSKADLQLSELRDKNISLAEEKDSLLALNKELASKIREIEVGKKIVQLSETGLGEHPGFLKQVEKILLADTGEKVIELSEDGASSSLTATDIVESLLECMPKADVQLSEQVQNVGAAKPAVDASEEVKPLAERTKEAASFIGLSLKEQGE